MSFLNLAKKRKSTYDFNDKKPSEKHIAKILEAGQWAPSFMNSQPWNFILVRDINKIDILTRTANYGDFHTTPAFMIAIVLKHERSIEDSVPNDGLICCGMAALQMILEAADLGVDSCLLTPEERKAKNILGIKSNDSLPLLVGFGYKRREASQKKRERLDLKEITFNEFFGKK